MGAAVPFILEQVPCCEEAKCGQAVSTEVRAHTFSSTPLLPQAILPFIKTFPPYGKNTVLCYCGKMLVDVICQYGILVQMVLMSCEA